MKQNSLQRRNWSVPRGALSQRTRESQLYAIGYGEISNLRRTRQAG